MLVSQGLLLWFGDVALDKFSTLEGMGRESGFRAIWWARIVCGFRGQTSAMSDLPWSRPSRVWPGFDMHRPGVQSNDGNKQESTLHSQ